MKTLVAGCTALLKLLMVLLLTATVIMVFGNAALRYLLSSGITVSEELSRWCFVWMIYLGGILLLKDDRHLQVTLLRDAMPAPVARVAKVLVILTLFGLCLMILRGSWLQMNLSWNTRAPASGLATAWLYLAGVVFGVSAVPILLYEFYLVLTGREPYPGYRSGRSPVVD